MRKRVKSIGRERKRERERDEKLPNLEITRFRGRKLSSATDDFLSNFGTVINNYSREINGGRARVGKF